MQQPEFKFAQLDENLTDDLLVILNTRFPPDKLRELFEHIESDNKMKVLELQSVMGCLTFRITNAHDIERLKKIQGIDLITNYEADEENVEAKEE